MCDHWMPTVRLPLTPDQFQQLPRHQAYRYEYFDGEAVLSPHTKHYHCLLPLRPVEAPGQTAVRPMQPADAPALEELFAHAFYRTQPFASLDEDTSVRAARAALDRTRTGGDGPWIEQASFVATADGRPYGAIFITLLPDADPATWDAYYWDTAPPDDAVAARQGRPHLTWIFVSPVWAGQGAGTALLAAAVRQLLAMGFTELLSTFMIGNDSSMLWHWRNGFQLLQHPASFRRHRLRG